MAGEVPKWPKNGQADDRTAKVWWRLLSIWPFARPFFQGRKSELILGSGFGQELFNFRSPAAH